MNINIKINQSWFKILKNLVPTYRYLNNNGIRKSFLIMKSFYKNSTILKFKKNEKSGYWTIPLSWEVKIAQLIDPKGKKIVEYFKNPLQVFSNSCNFEGSVNRNKLLNHIYSDEKRPNLTPFHYRNQFRENIKEWGFCLPYNKVKQLPKGQYKVKIKTETKKHDMHSILSSHKGKNSKMLLFVSHFDHPFQANDGISGSVATFELIRSLSKTKTKISYGALATPEIIGSIFFAQKYAKKYNIKQGLMCSFCGVNNNFVYAKTSLENTFIDKALAHILKFKKRKSKITNFRDLVGADEVAYDNVVNKIPCGSLYRWPYKYYHTNKDNIESVDKKSFIEYFNILKELVYILENNSIFFNKFKSLPKLSDPRIDLYISPRYWQKKNNKVLVDKKNQSKSDQEFDKVLDLIDDNELKKACIESSQNIQLLQSLIATKANGTISTFELAEKCNMPFVFVNTYLNLWERKKLIKKRWLDPFQDSKIK
jgi:aminopeptidase-like protein